MTIDNNLNIRIKEWLKKAEEDLISAEVLLSAKKERLEFVTAAIGFHCQQCVEKCLKGYMIQNKREFRKSHDIIYLLNLVKEIDNRFEYLREKALLLNEFAVNGRYPGYYDGFELEEAKESYEIAKQCLNTFKNTLE